MLPASRTTQSERAVGTKPSMPRTNRLVAGELERRWNEALTTATKERREAEERLKQLTRQLSDFELARVRRMAHDIGQIWTAATTAPRDKKRLLRAAIERVVITSTEWGIKVAVEWKGGEISEEELARRRRGDETRRKLGGKDAPEGWVGLDEAARRLGLSKQSVATWVKTGKLQAVRVACGRRTAWRICVNSTGLEKQTSLI
jgi:excisionase family DNA binding protein